MNMIKKRNIAVVLIFVLLALLLAILIRSPIGFFDGKTGFSVLENGVSSDNEGFSGTVKIIGGEIVSSNSANFNFDISPISIIAFPGETKRLLVSVKNDDEVFANKCHLETRRGYEELVVAEEIQNIGVGELVEFKFLFYAKTDLIEGFELYLSCLDGVYKRVPFRIVLLEDEINLEISQVRIQPDGTLGVGYELGKEPFLKEEVTFQLRNAQGNILASNTQSVDSKMGVISFDLSKTPSGQITVVAIHNNKEVSQTNILYNAPNVTGLSVTGITKKYFSIITIMLVFLGLSTLIFRRIWKLSHEEKDQTIKRLKNQHLDAIKQASTA